MRVLGVDATRGLDRAAVEEAGIPSLVLMENAAIGLADAVGELFPAAATVAIFCGPGNNGGDGLALGRHLDVRGYAVRLVLATFGRDLGGDAGVQLGICRHQGLELVALDEGADPAAAVAVAAAGADLLVDALFGTGLARPLAGAYATLVEALSEQPLPVLAVDLPSGLNGDRHDVFGPAVAADATVTFATPKPAQLFPPAAELVGELVIADLGIPPRLIEEAPGDLHLLTLDELAGTLPRRRPDSHKGDFGHLLVAAGSPGKAGAAILAARAAMRSGAGLVTVAVPAGILATVDSGSLESMTLALPAGDDGALAATAGERLLAAAEGKDVAAIGPGLGGGEETQAAIRAFAVGCPLPLVVDADGINAFAGRHPELARRRDRTTVLTPHPGELGRLLGVPTAEVEADRLAAARRAAAECEALVVLKGHLSLVAEPGGAVWVVPTGNPGMASGGSGDVLTGMVGALLGQIEDPAAAVRFAVYAHGLAGDLAAARRGQTSLVASDLVDALPAAFGRLAGGDELGGGAEGEGGRRRPG